MEVSQEVLKSTVAMLREYVAYESRKKKPSLWNSLTDRGPSLGEKIIDHFVRDCLTYNSIHYSLYAMTAKVRGHYFAEKYSKLLPAGRGRFLDVGCAWGGNVVAMAKAGAESIGFDINPDLLDFAHTMAAEEEVSARTKFLVADICKLNPGNFGQFDLISSVDVAEHVLEPDAAFANLSRMLSSRGTLILKIPNKYQFSQVESDPHHFLFGSTLLARPEAIRVYCDATGVPESIYDVGYFFTLEEYEERFARAGLVGVQKETCDLKREQVYGQISNLKARFLSLNLAPDWRQAMVNEALAALIDECDKDYRSPGMTDSRFTQKYGVPVFEFHLRRKS
jgi:SAM-dependent methyltransferase